MNTDAHGWKTGGSTGRRLSVTMRACGGRACASVLAVAATLLLAGCSVVPEAQPDLTRYYVLSATPPSGAAAVREGAPRVFVRAVHVPEFLRGKIMQVRMAANEVRYVDTARWAEALEPGIGRVVRDHLAARGAVQVIARGGDAHDYEVALQLRHCEGVLPAGVARLAARIEIFSAGLEPKLVAHDEFVAEIAGWDGADYGQLAGKLSEAAGALSERIVALLPTQ